LVQHIEKSNFQGKKGTGHAFPDSMAFLLNSIFF